jgi:hypothetical protein
LCGQWFQEGQLLLQGQEGGPRLAEHGARLSQFGA